MRIVLKKLLVACLIYLLTGILLSIALPSVQSTEFHTYIESAVENLLIFSQFDYGGIATSIARPRSLVLMQSAFLTFQIVFGAALVLCVLGVALGVCLAVYPMNTWVKIGRTIVMAGSFFPTLVVGILSIYLLSTFLGIAPFRDLISSMTITSGIVATILPMVVLAIGDGSMTDILHVSHGAAERILASDYLRAVRVRGLSTAWYILRGISVPVSAAVLSKVAFFIGSAAVVEYLFNWPGLGYQLITALTSPGEKDVRIILGAALIFVVATQVLASLAELVGYYADPRGRERS